MKSRNGCVRLARSPARAVVTNCHAARCVQCGPIAACASTAHTRQTNTEESTSAAVCPHVRTNLSARGDRAKLPRRLPAKTVSVVQVAEQGAVRERGVCDRI